LEIPPDFIDALLDRTDAAEIIGARVSLSRKGNNFWGLCPFHSEKTPSFKVSSDKPLYYCFGCKASGSIIDFLMKYDRLTFQEAIGVLATRAGMEMPRLSDRHARRQKLTRPLLDALQQATEYFTTQLHDSSLSHNARRYLQKRRIGEDTCKRYLLGYAPPGNLLLKTLGKKIPVEQLVQSGLLAKKDHEHYDRFRSRIMFPIRNRRGQVVAFGGRAINPEIQPKYLNSPETPVFHKKRELYGLHEAIHSNRHLDELIFVEGYTDVLALAQAGIGNVVACLGTALTNEHLQQAFRITVSITLCFDGDNAGQAAAWNSLKLAMPLLDDERLVRFALLPDGEDPDSLVNAHGAEGFRQQLSKAMPLSELLFKHLLEQHDTSTIEGKTRLIRQAKQLINPVKGPELRHLLEERLTRIVGSEVFTASRNTPPASRETSVPARAASTAMSVRTPRTMALSTRMIRDILHSLERPGFHFAHKMSPANLEVLRHGNDPPDEQDMSLLHALLRGLRDEPTNNLAVLLSRFPREPHHHRLQELALVSDASPAHEIDLHEQLAGSWKQLLRKIERHRKKSD